MAIRLLNRQLRLMEGIMYAAVGLLLVAAYRMIVPTDPDPFDLWSGLILIGPVSSIWGLFGLAFIVAGRSGVHWIFCVIQSFRCWCGLFLLLAIPALLDCGFRWLGNALSDLDALAVVAIVIPSHLLVGSTCALVIRGVIWVPYECWRDIKERYESGTWFP